MKFYDNKTYEDEIIEWMKEYKGCYEIKYLDDDHTVLIDKNRTNYQNKKVEMIRQAMERDKELYTKYRSFCIQDYVAYFTSLMAFALSTNGNKQLLSCLLIIIGVYFNWHLISDKRKLKELKKYRMFLDIRKDLEKKENKNILDVIEFDKLYQDPRGIVIENLDNYSYSDIKVIKKELKRRNNTK